MESQSARGVGKPTKLTAEVVAKGHEYLQVWALLGVELIPTAPGLALHVGVSSRSCYSWESEPDKSPLHEQWFEVMRQMRDQQHQLLLAGGLGGKFNSNIAKLVLTKHGYHDRVQTDVNNPDGRLEAKPVDLSGLSNEQLTVLAGLAKRDTAGDK